MQKKYQTVAQKKKKINPLATLVKGKRRQTQPAASFTMGRKQEGNHASSTGVPWLHGHACAHAWLLSAQGQECVTVPTAISVRSGKLRASSQQRPADTWELLTCESPHFWSNHRSQGIVVCRCFSRLQSLFSMQWNSCAGYHESQTWVLVCFFFFFHLLHFSLHFSFQNTVSSIILWLAIALSSD